MKSKFTWGISSASYQIEGHDESIQSIWDDFAKQEGKTYLHQDGSLACDHVRHFKSDIQLIQELGVDAYRLSLSWPRIQPQQDVFSDTGFAFYRELLSECRRVGLKTTVTLYHWDLPLWLYKKNGGWIARETVHFFADYAKKVFAELDDLVDHWTTLNEPFCSGYLGYEVGYHAPGHQNHQEYLQANHHLLLAHGMVTQYYKSLFDKPISIVLNLSPVSSSMLQEEDRLAIDMWDMLNNRVYLDPLLKGSYPSLYQTHFTKHGFSFDFIQPGDMETIQTPFDQLGVNYYSHAVVKYDSDNFFGFTYEQTTHPKTSMDWDVVPDQLHQLIDRLRKDYKNIPIFIAENGAAYEDQLINNEVNDQSRVNYIASHIQVIQSLSETHNVVGYYVWTLMDNYEWTFGYSKRFGLIHVDFDTLTRTPKNSYKFYQEFLSQQKTDTI